MLHALSTRGTIPPEYRTLISEMTTKKRGRENLIHRRGTPAHPAVDTAPVPDFPGQDPPPPAAQRETPEAPITAQEPVAPAKHSHHHHKFNNGTIKKN
eukprot:13061859-Ditylum_brightwellii.AAC.1